MNAFAGMLDTLHADPNFGIAATYQTASGTLLALRITWAAPTDVVASLAQPPVRAGSRQATLLVADLGGLVPQRGDLVGIGGVTYRVDDAERDPLGLFFTVTLVAAPHAGRFAIGGSGVGGTDTIG